MLRPTLSVVFLLNGLTLAYSHLDPRANRTVHGPISRPKTQAEYYAENNTWMLTVPETWNYKTILRNTGQGSVIDNSSYELFQLFGFPFPGDPDSWSFPQIYVNGTRSIYAMNALNYAIQDNYNATFTPYTDQSWALPVMCEWPISGTYSLLNRVLFYFLLVFALLVHHHEWLVAGALASATIYSGSAAVQAWVQFGVSQRLGYSGGDNDNEAIMSILASSLLMAAPLINWSRTLRRLQVRPILIYWVIIIFVGYVLLIVGQYRSDRVNAWGASADNIMTCNTKQDIPDFTNLGFIDHSFIQRYNCDDPCYNVRNHHPFHDTSSVISRINCASFYWSNPDYKMTSVCFIQCPRDQAETCWLGRQGYSPRDYKLLSIGYYVILPVAMAELFFVLFFGRQSPEDIRDNMFKFFVGVRNMRLYQLLPESKRRGMKKTRRILFAQVGALFFYAFALLTYIICVPFFVLSLIFQEWLLRYFPDAEEPWEAGQWLPWVGIVLVLGGSLVGKYHHAIRLWFMYVVFGRKKPHGAPIKRTIRRGINLAGWIKRKSWRTRSRLRLEWEAFKDFVTDPIFLVLDTDRDRTTDHPTVKYSFKGVVQYPGRQERHNRDNYQGPWLRSDTWNEFDVEFFVQADDRTLASWEAYQQRYPQQPGIDQHIVYSIELPVVPTYPDKRTVLAKAGEPEIVEKFGKEDPDAINDQTRLVNAITPGARKASTIAYHLQDMELSDSTSGVKSKLNRDSQVVSPDEVGYPKHASLQTLESLTSWHSSMTLRDSPANDRVEGSFWMTPPAESPLSTIDSMPSVGLVAGPRRAQVPAEQHVQSFARKPVPRRPVPSSDEVATSEPNTESGQSAAQPLLRRSSTSSDTHGPTVP